MFRHTSVALLLIALIGASSLAQQTRHVPGQYMTVQAAINAAGNGDTVLVAPGTYRESIDFKGKAITVVSSHGPHATVFQGGTVSFRSGERNTSVLDGFTITGAGPGIYCAAAPIIRNNIVTGNVLKSHAAEGGGIHCVTTGGTPAVILNNTITNNSAVGTPLPGPFPPPVVARGGGIFCRNTVVMGNTIANNGVLVPHRVQVSGLISGGGIYCSDSIISNNIITGNMASRSFSAGDSSGGGIHSANNTWIVNNTIVRNLVYGVAPGAGGVAGTVNVVANCIVRDHGGPFVWTNFSVKGGPIVFCNAQNTSPKNGNFNSLPQFTTDGTYHLGPTSPCRNAGSGAYLNFSASDHEWDNRGFGGGVDVGADEFAPHIYHVGPSQIGKTTTLTVIGTPGKVVTLGWAAKTLSTPITIPGIGQLWLDPATLQVWVVGPLPASGIHQFPLSIPKNAPIGSIPFQALVGLALTRPEVVQVAP